MMENQGWKVGFAQHGFPYTQRIPKDKKELFIEEVSSKYLDKVPLGADGKAHVAMVMIEVEAEKN